MPYDKRVLEIEKTLYINNQTFNKLSNFDHVQRFIHLDIQGINRDLLTTHFEQ